MLSFPILMVEALIYKWEKLGMIKTFTTTNINFMIIIERSFNNSENFILLYNYHSCG